VQFARRRTFPVSPDKLSRTDQKAIPDRFPHPRINSIKVAKVEPGELGRIYDLKGQIWGSAALCGYTINQLSVNPSQSPFITAASGLRVHLLNKFPMRKERFRVARISFNRDNRKRRKQPCRLD